MALTHEGGSRPCHDRSHETGTWAGGWLGRVGVGVGTGYDMVGQNATVHKNTQGGMPHAR